jgi:hypothetical protein
LKRLFYSLMDPRAARPRQRRKTIIDCITKKGVYMMDPCAARDIFNAIKDGDPVESMLEAYFGSGGAYDDSFERAAVRHGEGGNIAALEWLWRWKARPRQNAEAIVRGFAEGILSYAGMVDRVAVLDWLEQKGLDLRVCCWRTIWRIVCNENSPRCFAWLSARMDLQQMAINVFGKERSSRPACWGQAGHVSVYTRLCALGPNPELDTAVLRAAVADNLMTVMRLFSRRLLRAVCLENGGRLLRALLRAKRTRTLRLMDLSRSDYAGAGAVWRGAMARRTEAM